MTQADEIAKLRQHVENLEYRLEKQFEHLDEAIDQRDNRALDAAWGTWLAAHKIESYIVSFLAGAFVYWTAKRSDLSDFWAAIAAVFALSLVKYLLGKFAWNTYFSGWQKDKSELDKLPEWDSRASDLWD